MPEGVEGFIEGDSCHGCGVVGDGRGRAVELHRGRLDLCPMADCDHRRSRVRLLTRISAVILGSRCIVGMAMVVVADVEVVVEQPETVVEVEVEVVEPGGRHIAHDQGDGGGEHHQLRNSGRYETTHHRYDLGEILSDLGRPVRHCGAAAPAAQSRRIVNTEC